MRLTNLKSDLKELGYNVKKVKAGLEVLDHVENKKFYVVDSGEFLQISLKLITSKAFAKLEHREALLEFVLRLQYRPLGCRLAQSLGDFCVVADIYAEHQDADHIDNVVSKLHIFIFTFLEVINKVGRTGIIPSVAEIDKLVEECQSEAVTEDTKFIEELDDLEDYDDYEEDDETDAYGDDYEEDFF